MDNKRDIFVNYKGVALSAEDTLIVKTTDFLDSEGLVNWGLIEHGDRDGFDTRRIGDNGTYVDTIILPPGKKIIRYGFPKGRYTADEGTDYELLSLPYFKESMPYHEYIVQKNCEVECYVVKGFVAPGFGSSGGVIQYKHILTIGDSIDEGILKEDYEWIQKVAEK